jgi:hypothetical protein
VSLSQITIATGNDHLELGAEGSIYAKAPLALIFQSNTSVTTTMTIASAKLRRIRSPSEKFPKSVFHSVSEAYEVRIFSLIIVTRLTSFHCQLQI